MLTVHDHDDDELLDPAALFRCGWIDSRPFGTGYALVHDLGGQAVHTVPAAAAETLIRNTSFESLEDHARAAVERAGGSAQQVAGLRRQLEDCVERGLYISYADVQQALLRRAERRDTSVSSLAVVTCDRVAALTRCVESFGANLSFHDRDIEIVVFDDSSAADTRAQARDALRRLQQALDRPILYAGDEEKRAYIDSLCGGGDDWRSLLEFALFDPFEFGATYGANRNAFLLDTAGRIALSVDDDMACRVARSPDYDDVLSISSEEDSTDWWFFPDRAAALARAVDDSTDFVGAHEAMLGQTVGSCVAAMTDEQYLDLDALGGRLLHSLVNGDPEVAITTMGHVGDSGTGRVEHYLQTAGNTRERLMGDEAEYRRARTGRSVMRVAPFTTIGDHQLFMSGIFGLDNRAPAPPFFPVERGEDSNFAALLRGCRPNALSAYLPWCVFHDPPEARVASNEQLWGRGEGTTLQDVLMTGIGMVPLSPSRTDPVEGMERLADHLSWFSQWPIADIADAVRQRLCTMLAARVQFLEGLLEMYDGRPPWWARDVHQSIAKHREQATRPIATADAVAPFPTIIGKFAELLREWPRIVERARELGSSGHRIARSL